MSERATWVAAIAAAVAVPVSLLALGVSAWQAFETHTDAQRQLQPILTFDVEDDPDDAPFALIVENDGEGPAIVTAITYYLDGHKLGSPDDVLDSAKLPVAAKFQQFEPGDAFGKGQTLKLFWWKGTASKSDGDAFAKFLDERLAVKIEYKSLAGDTYVRCITPDKFDRASVGCR